MDKITSHAMVLGTDPNLAFPEFKKEAGIGGTAARVMGDVAGRATGGASRFVGGAPAAMEQGIGGFMRGLGRGAGPNAQAVREHIGVQKGLGIPIGGGKTVGDKYLGGMGVRRGMMLGTLLGGALGALVPGKDEEGNDKSMVGGALRGAFGGAMMGGMAGQAIKMLHSNPNIIGTHLTHTVIGPDGNPMTKNYELAHIPHLGKEVMLIDKDTHKEVWVPAHQVLGMQVAEEKPAKPAARVKKKKPAPSTGMIEALPAVATNPQAAAQTPPPGSYAAMPAPNIEPMS